MTFCLFYVSECTVVPAQVEQAIQDIVVIAREKNQRLGITGALLVSGSHFAQFLEGTEQNVRELMGPIERDPRHKNVKVLLEEQESAPEFSSWSLAYSGPSTFVQRRLAPLIAPSVPHQVDRTVREVVSMMRKFVAA